MTKIKNVTFYSYITVTNLLVALIMLGAIGSIDTSEMLTANRILLNLIPYFYFIVSSIAAVGQAKTGTSKLSMYVVYTLTIPFMLMLVPLFQNL